MSLTFSLLFHFSTSETGPGLNQFALGTEPSDRTEPNRAGRTELGFDSAANEI